MGLCEEGGDCFWGERAGNDEIAIFIEGRKLFRC